MSPALEAPPGLEDLSALVGIPLAAAERPAHGLSNRTDIVTAADGRRFAVQRLSGGPTAGHRIRVARAMPGLLRPLGVPVPAVVAADSRSRPPFVLSEFVAGRPGVAALADPVGAIALGREMGRLGVLIRSARLDALRLPATWADPTRLAPVATRWLARTGRLLEADTTAELTSLIARLPGLFAARPAVLAHGDWAPVNVLLADREVVAVVGVVDWEAARIADPLFDVAWWGALVHAFHPEAWRWAWPPFLEASAVELDRQTVARLRTLAALRMLEVLASARVTRDPEDAASWAGRLVGLLVADC